MNLFRAFTMFGGPGSGPPAGNQNAAKGASEATQAAVTASASATTPEQHEAAAKAHGAAADAHKTAAKVAKKEFDKHKSARKEDLKNASDAIDVATTAPTMEEGREKMKEARGHLDSAASHLVEAEKAKVQVNDSKSKAFMHTAAQSMHTKKAESGDTGKIKIEGMRKIGSDLHFFGGPGSGPPDGNQNAAKGGSGTEAGKFPAEHETAIADQKESAKGNKFKLKALKDQEKVSRSIPVGQHEAMADAAISKAEHSLAQNKPHVIDASDMVNSSDAITRHIGITMDGAVIDPKIHANVELQAAAKQIQDHGRIGKVFHPDAFKAVDKIDAAREQLGLVE